MYYNFVAIYFVFLFLITSVFYFPIAILIRLTTFLFDRRLAILHKFSSVWASSYTWLSPLWKVYIAGKENLNHKKTYVMVCNHQSLLDILIIYRIFFHFKWVAKASLYKIPVIGWNMWLNRYVQIDRGNATSKRKMLKECASHLERGSSIMIFPEGTRSRGGALRPFKEGAFLIALQQKVDILPMVIDDSYKALPEKGIIPRRKQSARLHILPAISYETFKDMNIKEISEMVREVIANELERMRK